MSSAISKQRELTIASLPDNISQVEEFVMELAEEWDIRPEVQGNVLVALTEAVNNAIYHGNQQTADKQVYILAVMPNPFLLEFTVTDEGQGFSDPREQSTLPGNTLEESGRGLYVMQALADHFTYHPPGNAITLGFDV